MWWNNVVSYFVNLDAFVARLFRDEQTQFSWPPPVFFLCFSSFMILECLQHNGLFLVLGHSIPALACCIPDVICQLEKTLVTLFS